jgi:hypothetical protein
MLQFIQSLSFRLFLSEPVTDIIICIYALTQPVAWPVSLHYYITLKYQVKSTDYIATYFLNFSLLAVSSSKLENAFSFVLFIYFHSL